jgi:hypothetical protein
LVRSYLYFDASISCNANWIVGLLAFAVSNIIFRLLGIVSWSDDQLKMYEMTVGYAICSLSL